MIYINIYTVYICFTISTVLIWVVTVLSFELVFFIFIMKWWFSYLEKKCEETVQLLSCCLWRKKKFGLTFQLTTAAKETEQNLKETKCICLFTYIFLNYFFYLFICIYSIFITCLIYLCIYVFICFIVCVFAWFWYREGGRFWAKGNKATSGEALPVVHCTERTFSTFVLCTNISKLQNKKT